VNAAPVEAPTEARAEFFDAFWFIKNGDGVIRREDVANNYQPRPSGAIGLELVYESYPTCDLTTLME
jgi:hypothetical protein